MIIKILFLDKNKAILETPKNKNADSVIPNNEFSINLGSNIKNDDYIIAKGISTNFFAKK